MSFADFWTVYPRKVAKANAAKAYANARKTFSHETIMASLRLIIETEWKGRAEGYIPHAASWLNREDHAERAGVKPEPSLFDRRTEADSAEEFALKFGQHICQQCAPEHVWQESGPSYNWIHHRVLACPLAIQEMKDAISLAKVAR